MTEATQKSLTPVVPGAVPIIGAESLSVETLTFIQTALGDYPHNIRTIYIDTKNETKYSGDVVAGWHDWRTRTIELNLVEIFKQAVAHTRMERDAIYCSLGCELWMRFTTVFLHELFHDWVLEESGMEAYQAADEDTITNYAIYDAINLGKKYTMSPPAWPNDPFFGKLFSEELAKAVEDKELEDWFLFQQNCLDNGLMYHDTEREIELLTYHEFQRMMSDDPDSDEWGEDKIEITPIVPETAVSVIQLPAVPVTPSDAPVTPPDITTTTVTVGGDEYMGEKGIMDDAPWHEMEANAMPNFSNQNQPPTPTNQTFNAAPNFLNQNTQAQPTNQTFNNPAPNFQTQPAATAPANQTFGQPQYTETPITMGPALPAEITSTIWQKAVYTIYNRCWEMIFNCGWQPDNDNAFSNLGHIIEHPLPIEDIPYAQQIVMGMDCTNPNGVQDMKAAVTTFIRGKLGKANRPAYVLYLNFFGKVTKRTIIAINPNTGSKISQMARQRRSCFVWNNNIPDNEPNFNIKCPVKVIENSAGNGQIHKRLTDGTNVVWDDQTSTWQQVTY